MQAARRSGLVMGFDTHMIAGSRACPSCTRLTHPTIANQTSRHFAEALVRYQGARARWASRSWVGWPYRAYQQTTELTQSSPNGTVRDGLRGRRATLAACPYRLMGMM